MNTATTKPASDEADIAAATRHLDAALGNLCTLFAWVDPQPSALEALLDEEDAGNGAGPVAHLCNTAAFMHQAAGELEFLMQRILLSKNMRELLIS